MYYLDILGGLYNKKVEYLVVGGLAVNLYGVPRVTQDIDIIISTSHKNITKVLSLLKELGYVPRLPVDPNELADPEKVKDWVENRNLKAFSFCNKKANYMVIDILLDHPLEFEKAFENKTVKKAGDIEIYLASIDDIIKTKKVSGRPQDLSDIRMLKKVKEILEAVE